MDEPQLNQEEKQILKELIEHVQELISQDIEEFASHQGITIEILERTSASEQQRQKLINQLEKKDLIEEKSKKLEELNTPKEDNLSGAQYTEKRIKLPKKLLKEIREE